MRIQGPDTWIIWLNLIGVTFALAVNIWSARRGWKDWSPFRYVVATIAAVYACGYIALLAGWVTLDVWSRFFRGVSPVAWFVVWAGPPIHAARITRRLTRSTVAENDAAYDAVMESRHG